VPSTSGKQHRFMAAVANNPKFAKKAGVPQSVGEEFVQADKGRKFFNKESEMKDMKGMKKMAMGGGVMQKKGMTTAKMGAVKTAAPSRDGVAIKGKTKGTMVKMAGGGKMGKC
jgi:hypothetical protein